MRLKNTFLSITLFNTPFVFVFRAFTSKSGKQTVLSAHLNEIVMRLEFEQEIAGYLRHQDYSLAVRRMLDLSLDTGNASFMQAVIQWSGRFRAWESNATTALPDAVFLEQADRLLQEARQLGPVAAATGDHLLTAEAIAKTYSKGFFRLKPISLKIASGEIIGVVGENGNGKTTLLRCLAGQLALDTGHIVYRHLRKPDRYEVRKHIAFIPQRIPRWYGMLQDNLHFSAAIAGIKGAQNELMVEFMLERLNLRAYANLDWNQISSGYRTRFELARILLQQPELLILDEPLANLDINAQQTILTDLRFLAKSKRHPLGVLLSSQQLHEVEKVADTVLFIKQGECLFQTNTSNGDAGNIAIRYVLELETTASRETLQTALAADTVEFRYNGGFYTISSTGMDTQELIARLLQQQVPISYFRDITHSTKRFF